MKACGCESQESSDQDMRTLDVGKRVDFTLLRELFDSGTMDLLQVVFLPQALVVPTFVPCARLTCPNSK